MPECSKNYTLKLDDLTNTRLEWLMLYSKEIGVPKTTKRLIVTRAIEVYLEYMEAEVALYHMNPRHKDIIRERTALIKASLPQESAWDSSKLPEIKLREDELFPTYSSLSKPPQVIPKLTRYVQGATI